MESFLSPLTSRLSPLKNTICRLAAIGTMSSMFALGSCSCKSVSRRKSAVSWPNRREAPRPPEAIMLSASATMFCHKAMLERAAMPSLTIVSPLMRVIRSLFASCTACISSGVKQSQRLMSRGMSCMSLAMVCSSLSSLRASAGLMAAGSLNSAARKRSVLMSGCRWVRAESAFSSGDS